MNGRFLKATFAASALLAITFVCAPADAAGQNGAARVAPETTAEPVLLKIERLDVDDDGKIDAVAYYDVDGDGIVDSEVIDIGATGTATILAVRCDADGDGRDDDWLVIDAASEQVRAALIDGDDDGETELVSYGDGITEPIPSERTQIVRTTNFH